MIKRRLSLDGRRRSSGVTAFDRRGRVAYRRRVREGGETVATELTHHIREMPLVDDQYDCFDLAGARASIRSAA